MNYVASGIESAILSPVCLPIPPPRHQGSSTTSKLRNPRPSPPPSGRITADLPLSFDPINPSSSLHRPGPSVQRKHLPGSASLRSRALEDAAVGPSVDRAHAARVDGENFGLVTAPLVPHHIQPRAGSIGPILSFRRTHTFGA